MARRNSPEFYDINYNEFNNSFHNASAITNSLMEKCRSSNNSFDKLIYGWMSFNCWATFVSGLNSDSDIMSALSKSVKMSGEFYKIYSVDKDFERNVDGFFQLFPIFDGRDYRRKVSMNQKTIPEDKEEFDVLGKNLLVKQKPFVWEAGMAANWSDCIWAIYQVRCNLFHGQKNPVDLGDNTVVSFAAFILEKFLELSACYQWTTRERVIVSNERMQLV